MTHAYDPEDRPPLNPVLSRDRTHIELRTGPAGNPGLALSLLNREEAEDMAVELVRLAPKLAEPAGRPRRKQHLTLVWSR